MPDSVWNLGEGQHYNCNTAALRLAGFAIQQVLVLVLIGAGTALVAGLIGYFAEP